MDKPNFAMLIGTKKPDHADDLGKSDEGMGKEEAEMSAVHDMMAALKSNDAQGFGAALHDYLEICYPQLAGGESADEGEPSDDGPSDGESY